MMARALRITAALLLAIGFLVVALLYAAFCLEERVRSKR